jgi:hypothetical protein
LATGVAVSVSAQQKIDGASFCDYLNAPGAWDTVLVSTIVASINSDLAIDRRRRLLTKTITSSSVTGLTVTSGGSSSSSRALTYAQCVSVFGTNTGLFVYYNVETTSDVASSADIIGALIDTTEDQVFDDYLHEISAAAGITGLSSAQSETAYAVNSIQEPFPALASSVELTGEISSISIEQVINGVSYCDYLTSPSVWNVYLTLVVVESVNTELDSIARGRNLLISSSHVTSSGVSGLTGSGKGI